MRLKVIFLGLLVGVLMPIVSNAATDIFKVRLLVGNDTTPPTVPTNLVTTPASTTIISLTWGASNDNFAVDGYELYRDSGLIATTSATTYTDTGLTASTLYSYEVRAFDAAYNYSATSTVSATSTLDIPVTPATSTPTTTPPTTRSNIISSANQPVFVEIDDIDVDKVSISIQSKTPVKVSAKWGRSNFYELGSSAYSSFKESQQVVVNNLDPNTFYEIEITTQYPSGGVEVHKFSFTTDGGVDDISPANVMGFRAVGEDGYVDLSWLLPEDADLDRVRVVSNDAFYPLNQADGYVLYEGMVEGVKDYREVYSPARYYSIFSIDESGNVSSGAITKISFSDYQSDYNPDNLEVTDDLPDDQPSAQVLNDLLNGLTFADVNFLVKGKVVRNRSEVSVDIKNDDITTISIPYGSLPENLKTIVVTLSHPGRSEETFSFLLRVNAGKTAYEATLGALVDVGEYQMDIEIFDFKTQYSVGLSGKINVSSNYYNQQKTDINWWHYSWLPLVLLILLLWSIRRYLA